MGDGTHATIERMGNTTFFITNKLLHLLNVLHVSNIRKILLFVSQFTLENNVFF